MKDFWDRNFYTGDGTALDEDAGGGAKLGMAEFSNGNFLGARYQYPEYFTPGSVQHYPLPSRDNSTNYKQVKADPSIGLDTYTLKNGAERKGIYVKKNGDGVTVDHLSRINYSGAKKFSGLSAKAFCTIDDPNVLYDYHDRLIPKAIEYSAGLLDYFFRGKIDVAAGYDDFYGEYRVIIANRSGQNLLGGGFTLLQEDASGTRTPVAWSTLNYTGELADGACLEGTLPGPISTTTKYVVVFKGTIGSSSGQALDSVDAGIAIAAKQFNLYPFPANDPSSGFRVRIQNYAQVVSALTPCDDCPASSLPAWDGTFDHVEYESNPYLNIYPSALDGDGLSINGKQLSQAYVWWDEFHGVGVYEVRIFCIGESHPIWVGRKTTGSDHTGEYVRAWDWLDGCQWFCSELERIVIESY